MITVVRLALVVAVALAGCSPSVQSHPCGQTSAVDPWDGVLAQPTALTIESVVSARWRLPRRGLINLEHPKAKKAGLRGGMEDLILPVHIIRHPEHGDFIVDTGIDRSMAAGTPKALSRSERRFVAGVRPVESLGSIIDRFDLELSGVLLTHMHLDHVLGLPDVPLDTPIYVGKGERRRERLFAGRPPRRELDPKDAVAADPLPAVIDLLGDGSIWAIFSPGHTRGSMAYLANAADGPVLFVGDTSHTQWGWDHGVEPGTYTSNHRQNRRSLARLRTLVDRHPQIRVVVSHQ